MKLLNGNFKISRAGVSILSGLLLWFVTGCSVIQEFLPPADPINVHQPALAEFPDVWTIRGRISVVNENESWYAKFNWDQNKEDFQISFTGPLGETELQISQIAQQIQLKTPSHERTSNDLQQLLYQETGWKFPVTALRYWIYGSINPEEKSQVKYDKQQYISDIYQAGWHIQYPKRMQVDQFWLPKKIIVTEQDVKIKIIITSWHLGESQFGEESSTD